MRIIIAGSRSFNRYDYLENKLLNFIKENNFNLSDMEIISGTANGADKLGEKFAEKFNINCIKFPADWNNIGKQAGFVRNTKMANFAIENNNKGILIAFWDGKSSGTKHMIETARKKGLIVKIYII